MLTAEASAATVRATVVERLSLLVTVKAYPSISTKYGEVVCVAGIRTDTSSPEWVRLYPIGFRELAWSQRFHKYQLISLEAEQHTGDQRPESYRPRVDSLELGEELTTRRKGGWDRRRKLVEPLEIESMCELARRQKLDGTSLGVFRPDRVLDLVIESAGERSAAQQLVAAQPSLFVPRKETLEEIPYRFSYRYSCGPACNGHEQSIIDWEIAQAFRTWRYDERERLEKIREHWFEKLCGPGRDTFFFAGNQHQHPTSFLMLGVFWPPRGGDT